MIDYQKAFQAIVSDSRYRANLDWGEAREGHSEGTVRAHIAEIEPNLEVLRPKLTDQDYWKLKLLIHTHDSFSRLAARGADFRSQEPRIVSPRISVGPLQRR
jgi:hypothetical protein